MTVDTYNNRSTNTALWNGHQLLLQPFSNVEILTLFQHIKQQCELQTADFRTNLYGAHHPCIEHTTSHQLCVQAVPNIEILNEIRSLRDQNVLVLWIHGDFVPVFLPHDMGHPSVRNT